MRQLLITISLALLAVCVSQRAFSQSADTSDLFLDAYMANEAGQQLETAGSTQQALEKYRYAASLLDQITRDDPQWQPIVVTYRKKKVSENITRLEQLLGPSGASPENSPIEGALPQKEENPDLGQQPPGPTAPVAPIGAPTASQQVRDELDELKSDLRASQEKLKQVESEKEEMAAKLDNTLKELDRSKVSEAELDGELKQAQDAYQNAEADHSATAGGPAQKQLLARISQLEQALKDTEADRDAANAQDEEDVRRAEKASETAEASLKAQLKQAQQEAATHGGQANAPKDLLAKISQLQQALDNAEADRDAADAQAAEDARRAAIAHQAIAAATKQLAEANAHNKEIEAKYADSTKLAAQLNDSKKQIDTLNGKLEDAQKQIAAVKADRDQVAAQRDQALADLSKARDAEKHVTELLAENTTLSQKLAADENTIHNFKSDSPEKDKIIADLRKQVSDTQAQLAAAKQDRDNAQSSLNDLQQQYDTTSAELAQLKANNNVSDGEKKTLTDENQLLKGIVLRELKQQAKRDEAKRMVMTELSQLQVQSDTLMKNIDLLGQPVVQLSDKERALFKDPELNVADTDDQTMSFSFAAPKQDSPTHPEETPRPAPVTTIAANDDPPGSPAPSPSPSATPMEVVKNIPATQPGSSLPPAMPDSGYDPTTSESMPPSGASTPADSASMPPDPTLQVPAELRDDARAAKDAFDRRDYVNAEKGYEKMLQKAPNNVYILSNLGVVYFRNEKWKLAEESLKKAIAVAPEDTFSHCTLGIVYYQEQRYDDAITSLTLALQIDPHYAVAHNYLGITASQKGWQEAAKRELEEAINCDPNYADAYFNLAVVYATGHPPDKEMAQKYYQQAIDHGAEPDPALEQLIK